MAKVKKQKQTKTGKNKAVKKVLKLSNKVEKTSKKKEIAMKSSSTKAAPVAEEKPLRGRKKLLKIQQYKPPAVTFMDMAMKGKVTSADLDTHIDKWHEDPEATNLLHEYLGLTPSEYKKLLADPVNGLQELVEKRLKKKSKK